VFLLLKQAAHKVILCFSKLRVELCGLQAGFLYIEQINEHLMSVSFNISVTRIVEDTVPVPAVKISTNVQSGIETSSTTPVLFPFRAQ
jgi:hypothetical protein